MKKLILFMIIIVVSVPLLVRSSINFCIQSAYNFYVNHGSIKSNDTYTIIDKTFGGFGYVGNASYQWNKWAMGLYSASLPQYNLSILTTEHEIARVMESYILPAMFFIEYHDRNNSENKLFTKYSAIIGFSAIISTVWSNTELLERSHEHFSSLGIGIGFEYFIGKYYYLVGNLNFITGLPFPDNSSSTSFFFITPAIGICIKL